MAEWVKLIWLEHDTSHAHTGIPAPNLFFTLHDYSWVDLNNRVVAHWIVEHAIGALTGAAAPKALADTVRTVCESLHAWGQIIQVGAMVARGSGLVRLVQGLPQQPISLRALDAAAELHDLHARLTDIFDRFSLQVAVGPAGVERAWIECSVQHEWSQALGALLDRRLLDPASHSRLERWLISPSIPGISFDCAYLKFGVGGSGTTAKAYLACGEIPRAG
jgi:hypothetical protein